MGKEEKMTDMIQTVDILLLDTNQHVLLIRRAKEPFMDKLVLPGGHVEAGETLSQAASRELEEEVGISIPAQRLEFLCCLDAPDRDPRPGIRISQVFWKRVPYGVLRSAHAGSDAQSIHLLPIQTLTPEMMGFDHFKAIEAFKRFSC